MRAEVAVVSAIKHWGALSDDVRQDLAEIGRFAPTWKGDQLKGFAIDVDDGFTYRAYRDAADCRRMAASLIAAADWLDLPGETADEDDA